MSAFDAEDVVELNKNEHELHGQPFNDDKEEEEPCGGDFNNSKSRVDLKHKQESEEEVEEESEEDKPDSADSANEVVQEDDIRSRHSSNSTEPAQDAHESPDLKQHEEHQQPVKEKNDENRQIGSLKKNNRFLQRDFTQVSVVKTEQDENDWAKKNLGTGRINNLIARFNTASVLDEKSNNNTTSAYKTDYGVGKTGKGRIRQDVFH